jgi:ERCC4-related helicase
LTTTTVNSLVDISTREYQDVIARSALTANTLVVIPTGLGKTIIALLVARERLALFPASKVVVMAPTRPLVLQHSRFFEKHLAEKIPSAVLTGEVPPTERQDQFTSSKVIFATPEVIRNDVLEERYSLNDVSLIVFDEAHRCVRDYAYSQVSEAYKLTASNPLILGLTASPSSRKARVEEICQKLAITNVQTRTEEDSDVTPYVQQVSVDWIRVPLPTSYKQVSRVLRAALEERVKKLKVMRQLPMNVPVSKRILLDLGERLRERLRHGGAGPVYGAIMMQAQSMSLLHSIELLETHGMRSLEKALERLNQGESKSAKSLSKDPRIIEAQKLATSLGDQEHPKLKRLRDLVRDELASNNQAKLIVFTQFRDSVETIVNNLTQVEGVSPVRFVGQATRSEDDVGLSQSEQMEILEQFRNGRYNVLVTTSIGEEGLHVPDVDHVIFFEAVPSEIRLIQRRGRTGRTRPGKMTVLIAEGTIDEAYYWTSKRREEQMHRFLETVKKKGAGPRPSKRKSTLDAYS